MPLLIPAPTYACRMGIRVSLRPRLERFVVRVVEINRRRHDRYVLCMTDLCLWQFVLNCRLLDHGRLQWRRCRC